MKNKNKSKQLLIIAVLIVALLIKYITLQNSTNIDENSSNEISTQTNITTNISITDIPTYSGEIVISINNDVPYFEDADITTDNFEYYSPLDELNRAQVAFANISEFTMPTKDEKRSSLSYKPTGWNQYLYGNNNSEHLYERCHLIAWQLGNENNNKRNLITGTSQMNSAMIEYENTVANWVRNNKDCHVLYRVTPVYEGENKLATGVEIEAKSVEKEGVCFNKFIYNIHSDFIIDYSTGEAKLTREG